MKFLSLIWKNIGRNLVRTGLTSLGTMFLVLVVTLVWSVLAFLNGVLMAKKVDVKALITEKWQVPSQMPLSYATILAEGAARNEGDIRPTDSMTWQFYGGTLDPAKRTRDNTLFAFAMNPAKINTMMDDLDNLPADKAKEFAAVIEKMKANRQAIILGEDRLKGIGKQVGDRIKLFGTNYRDIDLEFEIVGVFPIPRYALSAAFDCEYLNSALDQYPVGHNGKPHPLKDKTLNLVWLKVPDSEAFDKLSNQIISSPSFSSPAVKCEVSSSAIATFLEGYRDIFWGMRWVLGPAALLSLSIISANAISISVRERRLELAVLKVLGFRPWQILVLVLGESLLLGILSGFISSGLTFVIVDYYFKGIDIPIGFFPSFNIPVDALWWGPLVGGLAALLGSIFPAWSACRVKVTDVFSRVA